MPEKPDAPKESNDIPENTPQNNPPPPQTTKEELADLKRDIEKGN